MRTLIAFIAITFDFTQAAELAQTVPIFFYSPPEGTSESEIVAETPGMRAVFHRSAVTYEIRGSALTARFFGALPESKLESADAIQASANFFRGNDDTTWHAGVSIFRGVTYRGIYSGIDLNFRGAGTRLKSEFVVAPGADPRQIRIEFPSDSQVIVEPSGTLVVRDGNAELREDAPYIFQKSAHGQISIAGRFVLLEDHLVGFRVDQYDPSLALVIDPTVTYCAYVGGSGVSAVTGVAVDASGNLYLTGWTEALDFPVRYGVQSTSHGSIDSFIAKLDPTGKLLYATYIGGRGDDRAAAIAVDSSGNAYITGYTSSIDFPVASAIRRTLTSGHEAFVVKLNSSGTALIYSTYLGGGTWDSGTAIAADAAGNAFVAGDTQSRDFPLLNPAQSSFGGQTDAFIAKLAPAGTLSFSTLLGGSGSEHAGGIAIDPAGSVYVAGGTTSANFPLVNALQGAIRGNQDAFVTKIQSSGSAFLYSTYLGGTGLGFVEQANAIAVDAAGEAFVAGVSNSADFPTTTSAIRTVYNSMQDAFAAKLNSAGTALLYSTYLGGSGSNWAAGIALDASGYAYVAGNTSSNDFPVIGAVQSTFGGFYDAFLTKINPSGTALSISTFYGGSGPDLANAVAVDTGGNIFVGGQTNSSDFPVLAQGGSSFPGSVTGWIMRYGTNGNVPPSAASVSPSSGSGLSQSFSLTGTIGTASISGMYFLLNSSLSATNGCFVEISVQSNQIFLWNDAGTGRIGGASLGQVANVGNSQCTLNSSTLSQSGSRVIVTVALTFSAGFAGLKNSYLYVYDGAGLHDGYTLMGSWSPVSGTPSIVSISPSSGSGMSQSFVLTASDPSGATAIAGLYFLLNTSLSGTNSCFLEYSASANKVYLWDNAAMTRVGGLTVGSSGNVSNGGCSLTGANAVLSGATLTLTVSLSFSGTFSGSKNSYLYVYDASGARDGYRTVGSWTVSAGTDQPPQFVSLTPASGSGRVQSFTITFSDPNGASDIAGSYFLLNSSLNATAGCFIEYVSGANLLYLWNDLGNGRFNSIPVGSNSSISNSQCGIVGSSVSSSGNILVLTISLTFPISFSGTKNAYLYAYDFTGLRAGYLIAGQWTVQ